MSHSSQLQFIPCRYQSEMLHLWRRIRSKNHFDTRLGPGADDCLKIFPKCAELQTCFFDHHMLDFFFQDFNRKFTNFRDVVFRSVSFFVIFVGDLVVTKDIETQNSPFIPNRFPPSSIKDYRDSILVVEQLWIEKELQFVPCVGLLRVPKRHKTGFMVDNFPIFQRTFLLLLILFLASRSQCETYCFCWTLHFKIGW